ncbi:MAG TPA: response regulator [Chloroflexota bacterium]|nr:response regulator [Chloroflexota bacterium]HUM69465.1 response regulator [Chloroflexota bacterium]
MQVVLIVDDNTAVRMVISDFLTYTFQHVKVLQAMDGVEGMALAREARPDLILLDAEMPNMNGFEVAQHLRASSDTQMIPIIAISSGPESNPIVSGLRAISDATLPKPFSPDELVSVVNGLKPISGITA